jgi:uncharacterized membrane protein
MLALFTSLKTAQFWLKAAPYLVIAAAVLSGILWVHHMQSTIAKQDQQINTLAVNLKAEQQARARDVAGLTTLTQGLARVSADSAKDAQALSETIDAKSPHPVSPELGAFLDRLRTADTPAAVARATK